MLDPYRVAILLKYCCVCQTGEANLERPFLNEAIIDVLKERYFWGKKSLYRLFPLEFTQSLIAEDGGRGLEIPPRLVALVATFVQSTGDLSVLAAEIYLDLLCPCEGQQIL